MAKGVRNKEVRRQQDRPPSPSGAPRQHLITQSASITWTGATPPPAFLREYDEISPGVAKRILAMAPDQQDHRLAVENKLVDQEIADRKVTRRVGSFVAIGAFLVAAGLVWRDDTTAGATLAALPLLRQILETYWGKKKAE
jgi:uncharacterized membrane protein